jgi:hypothetical protein
MKLKVAGGVILGALLSILYVGVAEAHTFSHQVGCGGLAWNAEKYNGQETNSIVVTIDGAVVYSDANFGTTDTGSRAWNQTADHTWSIVVDAPGTQFDHNKSGTQKACQQTTTTTTIPEETTTSTTTSTTTTTQPTDTTTTSPTTSTSTPPESSSPSSSVSPSSSSLPPPPSSGPVTNPPDPPAPTLPPTGMSTGILLVAFATILLGGSATLIARRR